MKIVNTIKIIPYTTSTGKQPFLAWQKKLSTKTESIVLTHLGRVKGGNFGSCKPVKGSRSIYEICIDYGPGYRIYYGKHGATIVVLLAGGEKGSQDRDIAKAKEYWLDFKGQEHD